MKKSRRFIRLITGLNAIILAMGIGLSQHSSAAVAPSDEIQALTVAYLYNFMKLSEWPAEVQIAEFTLCVTQEDDFAKELESLTGKEAQNHPLKIKRLVQGDDAEQCQLIFISSTEKPLRMQAWLNSLQNLPVLTVSDLDGFLDQGGMIALIYDGMRLQFEVNLERVEHTGIKLSSKMLQIAREVRGE
jgi:hypothetical protein